MPLTDLPFKPGFFSNPPDRVVGLLGYWKGGDKVRFRDGFPETIGGWVSDDPNATPMLGYARGVVDWLSLAGERMMAFGTHYKLYVWSGGVFYDITPIRATTAAGDVTFSASNGSTTLTVTDVGHGALEGDYVTFSGAVTLGGTVTADVLNAEHQIASVTSSDVYTITLAAAADGADVGNGGAAVVGAYQINVGNGVSQVDFGWGIGPWGDGTWGTPRSDDGLIGSARTWALDTWGEDLIASHNDGEVYVWDLSGGTAARATLIANAPTDNKSVFVSQEARHIIALGADGDPLAIRWCTSEDYDDWTPTTTNTAGDARVDRGSRLLRAIKVRSSHLVFTDEAVYAMQYDGPPSVFSIRGVGLSGGVVGPNAITAFTDICYWMGKENFYLYDGTVRVLPCSVYEYVFRDFNTAQVAQVWAGVNSRFNEIWWLYCSESSDLIDRYVAYNVVEKTWITGTLERTLFVGDSDVISYPYAIDANGYLIYHEFGEDADGENLNPYVESGDVEISQGGDKFMHVSKLVPDFKRQSGDVTFTVTTKRYPQASETQSSGALTATTSTQFINPRVRGRQMSVKVESNSTTSGWRMGMLRLEMRPHGRR